MVNESVDIILGSIRLQGFLKIPQAAQEVVIFAHGSGSSRLSPRNQLVADYFHKQKIGTLLFDLLTGQEEQEDKLSAGYRFNISFLSGRLVKVADWLCAKLKDQGPGLALGYFGASTGAAAALVAAVERPDTIKAVVSRGGRPDLADLALAKIKVPTLLIVGSHDPQVLDLNRRAYQHIHALKQLHIVKGATHLFEESGALEEVARIAAAWFKKYLKRPLW